MGDLVTIGGWSAIVEAQKVAQGPAPSLGALARESYRMRHLRDACVTAMRTETNRTRWYTLAALEQAAGNARVMCIIAARRRVKTLRVAQPAARAA